MENVSEHRVTQASGSESTGPEAVPTAQSAPSAASALSAASAASGQEAVSPRGADRTGWDMAKSLAVLLIPILLIGALLRACGSSDPTVVDTTQAIDDARSSALFAVVTPQGLDEGWRPVQATFRRAGEGQGTLRLGYLTPAGGQALVIVSNEEPAELLARELGDQVRPQGEVSINGRVWDASIVRGDEHALVDLGGTRGAPAVRTVIVVGDAPLDELTALAASLR
jgi:hypothetical protein